MNIYKAGSRPSQRANSDYFTGTVWQDPIVSTPEPARLNALSVHFEPGARTAWHSHPLGQTLHVTRGAGLICMRGQKPQALSPGDTVWIPPDIEHWHGATPKTHMTHIAMQEMQSGSAATWLEHVTDIDYNA
ncbi:MAG: cupin domain-containing protein [Tateyamaria sp.]|jgi:quercetin dioxygenase-like cupin family protein|nr:cupin domain-containing protein [Tateyamaria sp.]MDG1183308.1 cupin domain-containing protein [Tateyamaria sp.]MDG2058469.1 cupin domain-containing protein [Tateyamaria sp.]